MSLSFQNIAYYFTGYTFTASILVYALGDAVPPFIADVVRTAAALVAVSTVYVHARLNCHDEVHRFYERVFQHKMSRTAGVLVDVVTHFLPFFLNGPPRDPRAIPVGYAVLALWYLRVRPFIQELYIPTIALREYDTLIFAVLPGVAAAFAAARALI